MSVKEIKALVHRLTEGYNKGKESFLAVLDGGYANDVVVHSSMGQDVRGLKNYKQLVSEEFTTFSDLHITIDDVIVEGNKVAARWTVTGTHKGEREGIPPTDKKVTMWAITIYRVVGGKVVEEWSRYDTLGMMQQLGAIPTPGKGK
jgi:steroid delta-isomerase-like uncharacterized protein